MTLDSYLRFGPDGEITATDYVVVGRAGAPVLDGAIAEGEDAQTATDRSSGVTLAWRTGLVVLLAGLRSPGTGWVSAGFDPVQRMQGANYVLAAVTPTGLAIEDHFGTGTTSHAATAGRTSFAPRARSPVAGRSWSS